jgi:hypothetical protein
VGSCLHQHLLGEFNFLYIDPTKGPHYVKPLSKFIDFHKISHDTKKPVYNVNDDLVKCCKF